MNQEDIDLRQFDELRKELRYYNKRTTICTPSFLLSRKSPGISTLLGWIIFIFFITIVLFMLVVMYKVMMSYKIPPTIKIVIVGFFALAMFMAMIGIFIVDALTSQEEKQTQVLELTRKIEKHAYNTYQVMKKTARGS